MSKSDPGLKVYVEYGVETWNGNFWHEFNYVRTYAQAHGIDIPTATGDLAETNCFNYWSQAFAGQTNRLERIVSTQTINPSLLGKEVTEIARIASPNDPNHGFDVVSGATYVIPDTSSFGATRP